MAYSEDYRKRVIEYRTEGHTLMETSKVFKVAIITIRQWENKLKEDGTLKKKPLKRSSGQHATIMSPANSAKL